MKNLLQIAILSMLLFSCNQQPVAEADSKTQEPDSLNQPAAEITPAPKMEADTAPIKIGNSHGGGIIFYIDESGEHGKVCSPADMGDLKWKQANEVCTAFRGGGQEDWGLPTKEELNQIYTNLYKNGLGGLSNDTYWTAEGVSYLEAWQQNFYTGEQGINFKNYYDEVRAVRAF
ncbi:MAG: hypothetical protein ACI8P3_002686 [Saprospiraceae bacterium]|jgi:hypothetical protein